MWLFCAGCHEAQRDDAGGPVITEKPSTLSTAYRGRQRQMGQPAPCQSTDHYLPLQGSRNHALFSLEPRPHPSLPPFDFRHIIIPLWLQRLIAHPHPRYLPKSSRLSRLRPKLVAIPGSCLQPTAPRLSSPVNPQRRCSMRRCKRPSMAVRWRCYGHSVRSSEERQKTGM